MKKIIILLSLSLWFVLGFSVALQHVPPQTYMYGKPVELTAEIQQGLEETTQVKLYFRVLGSEIWLAETMKPESKGAALYRLTLPSRIITTEPIEYYFEVTTITGKLENFPALDGITPKFQLVPAPLEGEMSPGFIRLNDEPSISAEEGYLLAVSFFSIKDDIDLTSIEVWVNGRKVEAEIKSPLILFKDTKPLPGTKKAFVKCQLGTKSIHSEIWTTEVLPSSQKREAPIEYNGTVNFASNVYGYSKKANAPGVTNSDAATWTDLYGSYGMADFQTNLYISSLEKSNQQPVNRYTFGVKIPHLEVFAGDYSPTLSQLTMNNKNIRGLYARTFNKYVSLTWAHGQSVRKTTSELDVSDASGIQKSGTFKQEAIGMRMQLGNSQETMLGVNLTRHRDIVSSLDSLYYMFTDRDTIYTTPARDNAVASTDIRINMTDQNVILGAEVAASLLNKNTIPGAIDRETLESYTGNSVFVNPEDFSSLFVLNKNMEPLIPGKANVAWLVYLRTFFWNNFVNIQYSQTGSAFNALGASYQLNDSRSVVFTDQLNISRYFVLSGGLTHTADNLMNHKSETNKYTSWHFQSIIRPNKLPYLRMAYYNNNGKNKNNLDINVNPSDFESYTRNSNSFNIGMGYNVKQLPYAPTQVDISYRSGADKMKTSSVIQTDNENSGLTVSLFSKFIDIPLSTQLSLAFNGQKQQVLDTQNRNQSILLGANYLLWDKRIKPYANYRWLNLSGDQGKQYYGYLTFGAEAYPIKDMTVSTDLGFQNHGVKSNTDSEYGAFTWRLLLSQAF